MMLRDLTSRAQNVRMMGEQWDTRLLEVLATFDLAIRGTVAEVARQMHTIPAPAEPSFAGY